MKQLKFQFSAFFLTINSCICTPVPQLLKGPTVFTLKRTEMNVFNVLRPWRQVTLQHAFIGLIVMISLASQAQTKKSALRYFEESDQAIQEGNWQAALAHLNECVRLAPGYAEAYYSRGMVREQLADLQGAITDYNIYIDLHPDHYEALFSRAVLHYTLGHYAMAKADFLKVRSLPHQETTAIFFKQDAFEKGVDKIFTMQGTGPHFIYNYLGLIETRLKDYSRAIRYLDSAVNINDQEPDYLINRGWAKEESGDYNGALLDYRHALQLDPDNALAKRNISTVTERAEQTSSTPSTPDPLLNEAIDSNPHLPYAFAARAYKRSQQKDWKGAIDDYSQAIKIDSTNKDYYYNRGIVKENINDWNGALYDYIKAISLQEDFVKAWVNHGKVLMKLNRADEAIEDYTVAITYHPDYAIAYYNRALAYYKLKNRAEACKDLSEAERLKYVVDGELKKKVCVQ